MSFDGRITRLERELRTLSGERPPVTWVMILQDPHEPLEVREVEEFLRTIAPERTARVFHLGDNGRGEGGPRVTFGGDGWEHPGLDIRDGHIVGDWRGGG